jgi:hypothetical protein
MEAVLRQAPHAVAVLVSALLVLAAVHKVRVVGGNGATNEPLVKAYGVAGSTLASTILVIAATVELGTAAALLAYPEAGYFVAAGLIGLFARALKRLPMGQPCACFGEGVLQVSRATAIARNIVLSTTTFILGIGIAVGFGPDRWRLLPSAEAVLLLATPVVAVYAMQHVLYGTRQAVRQGGEAGRYPEIDGHSDVSG